MPFESELALEAALPVFGRAPGSIRRDDADASWLATGRPWASFNHVWGIRSAAAIDPVTAALRRHGSLPATWWIGPSTRPADLAAWLAAAGMREEEPEFGMVRDLGLPLPASTPPAGASLEELAPGADLEGWIAVMGSAYDWRDQAKAQAISGLYRLAGGEDPPWVHVLAREAGRPVACASLFDVGGHAFVTNVGTVPEARGRGLGRAVTIATLEVARRRGHAVASLTASVMGRSMYAALGFRDEARFERYVLDG